MKDLLNSTVLTAGVAGLFSLLLAAVPIMLSRKKSKVRGKNHTADDEARDKLKYAGYESLLKQQEESNRTINIMKDAEIKRLYEAVEMRDKTATLRETLIDQLREELQECYATIKQKDNEITQIRHLREYQEHASAIIKKEK